jgi:single-strand DNA-binding protein
MPGLPEVTITGSLIADPEIKFLADGAAVANFVVAANERRYDRERGEWVDVSATFLRCSIWRQAAENVVDSLHKGDRVVVVGALKQHSWETDEGEKRTGYELAATEVAASLKWATARVAKAKRSNGSGTGQAADTDPWSVRSPAPVGTGARQPDEPPF